jgi:hypothetical protein
MQLMPSHTGVGYVFCFLKGLQFPGQLISHFFEFSSNILPYSKHIKDFLRVF